MPMNFTLTLRATLCFMRVVCCGSNCARALRTEGEGLGTRLALRSEMLPGYAYRPRSSPLLTRFFVFFSLRWYNVYVDVAEMLTW